MTFDLLLNPVIQQLWANAGNTVSAAQSARYNVKEMNLTGNMSKKQMRERSMKWRSQEDKGEINKVEEDHHQKIRPMEMKVYEVEYIA